MRCCAQRLIAQAGWRTVSDHSRRSMIDAESLQGPQRRLGRLALLGTVPLALVYHVPLGSFLSSGRRRWIEHFLRCRIGDFSTVGIGPNTIEQPIRRWHQSSEVPTDIVIWVPWSRRVIHGPLSINVLQQR